MYEQVEKPKENKSRAVVSHVTQKKSNSGYDISFVGNQSGAKRISQLHEIMDNSIAQLEFDEEGAAAVQQELLDLANELQKYKSEGTSVSEDDVEIAISILRQAALSDDINGISKGITVIKQVTEKAKGSDKSKSQKEPAQFSGWRFAGLIIGGILGSIVPIIGNIFGAVIGYKIGKKKDDLNRLIAAGATQNEAVQLMNLEVNSNVTPLVQLFGMGFDYGQITTLLMTLNNATTIVAVLNLPMAIPLNRGNQIRLIQLNNLPLVRLMNTLFGRRAFGLSGQGGRNVYRFHGGTWAHSQVDCNAVFGPPGVNRIRRVQNAPNGQQQELYRIMSNGVAVILRSWSSEIQVLATIEIQDGPRYEFKYEP